MLRMMEIPADGELMERYLAVGNEFGDLRWKLLSQPADDALRARASEVSLEMRGLLMPFLDARRSGEGDDLISRLWRATPDLIEGEINDDAMYANLTTLFEAGVGTGAGAIGDVLYVLMKFPDYQERSARGPVAGPQLRRGGVAADDARQLHHPPAARGHRVLRRDPASWPDAHRGVGRRRARRRPVPVPPSDRSDSEGAAQPRRVLAGVRGHVSATRSGAPSSRR